MIEGVGADNHGLRRGTSSRIAHWKSKLLYILTKTEKGYLFLYKSCQLHRARISHIVLMRMPMLKRSDDELCQENSASWIHFTYPFTFFFFILPIITTSAPTTDIAPSPPRANIPNTSLSSPAAAPSRLAWRLQGCKKPRSR